jgi:hypothetical protein
MGMGKSIVVALGAGTALFFGFIVAQGLRAQRVRPATGVEGLKGAAGAEWIMTQPVSDSNVRRYTPAA